MPDVTVPSAPALGTIRDVELIKVGHWEASTGPFDPTPEDIAACIAAVECPAVHSPALMIGHTDPRWDGEPALGWADNLRAKDDGYTLTSDWRGIPAWMLIANEEGVTPLAAAWPQRSIEGRYDFRCALGHTHPFALTAVALLGVSHPAIGTLDSLRTMADIEQAFGVSAASDTTDGGTAVTLSATTREGQPMAGRGEAVSATVTTVDIQRAYYELNPSWDIWIMEMQLDPTLQLIVEDEGEGVIKRVPVIVGEGEGQAAVSFGDPVPVTVRYEDAAVAASSGKRITYASKAESRPGAPVRAADTTPKEEPAVFTDEQLAQMRKALGLPDDADAQTILDAQAEALAEQVNPAGGNPDVPATPPTAPVIPEGTVLVDASRLAQLEQRAAMGEDARKQQLRDERNATIEAAWRDGRITRASVAEWTKRWELAPEDTKTTLAALAPGLVPTSAPGYGGQDVEASNTADLGWFPDRSATPAVSA